MVWWLFQNLVSSAALAVIVAAICRATRIGPAARHALWVVVLVKLITPPIVVWPWPVPDPFGLATVDVRVDIRRSAGARVHVAAIGMTPAPGHRDVPTAETVHAPSLAGDDGSSAVFEGGHAFVWFVWIWAIGSVGVLTIEGTRLVRLARRVTTARSADAAIAARVAELGAHLRLRPVPVVSIAGIASPMVWCLGRPRLLWPADLTAASSDDRPPGSSESRIDGVIVHELAHVKRGDHLVGWLELFAGIVWWWNPLFWYVRSSLREQAELACDAWVISALPDGRRAYAEALLALSGAAGSKTLSRSMSLVGIRAGSRRALERRLVMIMKGRAPLRLPAAGLVALALMIAATLPAWATVSSQQAPPPPPVVPAAKPKPLPQVEPPPPAPPVVEVQAKPVKPDLPPRPPLPPPAVVLQFKPEYVRQPPPRPLPARRDVLVNGRKVATSPPLTVAAVPPLPADSLQLLDRFDADRKAIREEADRKITERRAEVVKALEDLQEQYTKAGKLDEAVAIRNYLRAGGPRLDAGEVFLRPSRR